MAALTKRTGCRTPMIHKEHSAAMLMSNYGSALMSRMWIMNSELFLQHSLCAVPSNAVELARTPVLKYCWPEVSAVTWHNELRLWVKC